MTEETHVSAEHIEQLQPYLNGWHKSIFGTNPMTDNGKEAIKQSVQKIVEANNNFYTEEWKKLSPINNIVFVDSPFVMRFASAIASYMWHNYHLNKPVNLNLDDYVFESPLANAVIDAVKQATRGISQSIPKPALAEHYDNSKDKIRHKTPIIDDVLMSPLHNLMPTLANADEGCTFSEVYTIFLENIMGSSEFISHSVRSGMVDVTCGTKCKNMLARNENFSTDLDHYAVDFDELAILLKIIHSQDEQFSEKYLENFYCMCFGTQRHLTPSEAALYFYVDVVGVRDSIFDLNYSLRNISLNCGIFTMFPDFCMACERPEQVHMDKQGRYHNEHGPAIKWKDGTCFYLIRDNMMPRWILEHPERITPQKIRNCDNSTHKSAMLNAFTPERFINETKLDPIDKDESGDLSD